MDEKRWNCSPGRRHKKLKIFTQQVAYSIEFNSALSFQ